MTRQMEVPGTERKYSKEMRKAGDAYADAVKEHSRTSSKKKEKEQLALEQMKREGLDVYVDTEADPPFQLVREGSERIVRKAYKPPEPGQAEEGEPEEAEDGEQRARKKKAPSGGAGAEA